MKARTFLLVMLGFSTLVDGALALLGFVAPEWMLAQFKMPVLPETLFLGHVVSWFLLLFAGVFAVSFREVKARQAAGWTLSCLAGAWLVGIGMVLAFRFGRLEHLLHDTGRGLAILALAYLSNREIRRQVD